jgi:hypothetical protein
LPTSTRSAYAYKAKTGDVREYVTKEGVADRRPIQPHPKGRGDEASVRKLRTEKLDHVQRKDQQAHHNWRAKKSEYSSDQPHLTGRENEESVRKLLKEKLRVREREQHPGQPYPNRREQKASVQELREKRLTPIGKGQPTCRDRRVREREFRPGQLVYRKLTVKGRGIEPKWLGPYEVLKKINDLVCRIRIGKRHVNLNTEQLKLCRATRPELRERRRQNRRRMIEQRPRPDSREEYADSISCSESEEESVYSFAPREGRKMDHEDSMIPDRQSEPVEGDTRYLEENNDSGLDHTELLDRDGTSRADYSAIEADRNLTHRYLLRPRVRHIYKE